MSSVDHLMADVQLLMNSQQEHEKRFLLTRIEMAAQALKGQEREADKGPWCMSPDGLLISSDNFDHDVQLKVSGDFYGAEDRAAYSRRLVSQLNGAQPLRQGLPEEPPAGLLYSMALRYRHDFGLNRSGEDGPLVCGVSEDERRAILTTMRQLYEEVAGHGFFTYT